jgi:N4-(beta-N-acetylglucosaminyl)-L-asparaginase
MYQSGGGESVEEIFEREERMSSKISRRVFVKGSAAAGLAGPALGKTSALGQARLPLVISSANGMRAIQRTYQMIKRENADTLEAVIAGVSINEEDPEDNSVGYGGLPNEEGVVELDASVMHGPSRRAGAVAALRDIKTPSKVAYLVMKRTDHILLVGEGALKFALAHGFPRENLLTEKSRIAWLAWKERHSERDNWGPGLSAPEEELEKEKKLRSFLERSGRPDLEQWVAGVLQNRPWGTINCIAINERREMSGATTTSGLAWKIPGRVGDSPLIGSGLYVDNDIGAAGSTGRGEEAIRINGAHTVVEAMRKGASPQDACLEALSRVARNYENNREKLARFNLTFYAMNKEGRHGAAALWNEAIRLDKLTRSQYAVMDSQGARLVDTGYLLKR